ncbi:MULTISPECIES: sensor histidine kinase [unclassified Streptomyces]|uniref:sensor histidine kinase n=1 Tax=unclassified Streptomyces TaxID=2593676 RepID=UPI002251D28E|nr:MULTISPECIES: ATP-binding protein [unclassified Streptomyces]WSP59448.1 ATP-binding protein [Streptomyces sp. NBC_01241]WSU20032.1 ATP-binding protein [Streptomyces sp. NBC_01108]MCX4791219.1 ATP-binding protein [Streptomyces sp. NBC_01221]MCX4793066.1 ATP-binding protein [Streptomyces sp. NBC_01242]WSP60961.1 ATP-binding protein [Streptomyces sp. NBC_01240]
MRVDIRAWWSRRSLRLRLTVAAALMIVFGLAGAAVLLVLWLHATLINELDQTALQDAQVVAATLQAEPRDAVLHHTFHGEAAVQVVDAKGAVQASSANLRSRPRLFDFPPSGSGIPHARTVQDLTVGDDSAWRAVAVPAGTRHDPMTVYVAMSTEDIDHGLAKLTFGLATTVPSTVALLTGIVWLLTGRALRPVDSLRAQTAEITASDLGRRLDVPPAEDALGRLAKTLNDLLARLEATTRRQRGFVADAAHELRSPLSTLHTRLEVAVSHPDTADWRSLAPALLAETERLSRLVDDLVQLARLDARPRLRKRPVDLDEIVFTEVGEARQRTSLVIDQHAVSAARVHGDRDALARVVRNLLDNALRHAATRIDIRLYVLDGIANLIVADDGPGIPAADRQRVFERFTRLDQARARDTGGSGLGLAIVRDIVTAHHGSAHIETNQPGARIVVRIPVGDR